MAIENPERKFLHDIASPVGTALFVLDMLLENMNSRKDASPEELTQAQQISDLLAQIKKAIENRRATIIQQEATGKKP